MSIPTRPREASLRMSITISLPVTPLVLRTRVPGAQVPTMVASGFLRPWTLGRRMKVRTPLKRVVSRKFVGSQGPLAHLLLFLKVLDASLQSHDDER
jgi:hypothetical protein